MKTVYEAAKSIEAHMVQDLLRQEEIDEANALLGNRTLLVLTARQNSSVYRLPYVQLAPDGWQVISDKRPDRFCRVQRTLRVIARWPSTGYCARDSSDSGWAGLLPMAALNILARSSLRQASRPTDTIKPISSVFIPVSRFLNKARRSMAATLVKLSQIVSIYQSIRLRL